MIKTRRFFSVTIMTGPEDDGYTTTFETAREAADFADWARAQGVYFVSVWAS